MKRAEIMVVAGDPSGDANAAGLVRALAELIPSAQFQITPATQPLTTPLAPHFFGAGGPKMAAAGVELAFDLTAQAIIGVGGLLTKIPRFLRYRNELVRAAAERQPDLILLVDFGAFNSSLAGAIRRYVKRHAGPFFNWSPKIVQFTSPQVWGSRPGRARKIAARFDLLLSLFAFEKPWYAERVPQLPVEFVGNPLLDRYPESLRGGTGQAESTQPPLILLLPGSRRGEIKRHVPVMCRAAALIVARQKARFAMILPDEAMLALACGLVPPSSPPIDLQVGGIGLALSSATMAITKSGTITVECACFQVPAVVMYRTDPFTYFAARASATVKYLSMPNLIANEEIYPEFIQGRATPANVAAAALDLLGSQSRRAEVRAKLAKVVQALGSPGATRRAAAAIVKLLETP